MQQKHFCFITLFLIVPLFLIQNTFAEEDSKSIAAASSPEEPSPSIMFTFSEDEELAISALTEKGDGNLSQSIPRNSAASSERNSRDFQINNHLMDPVTTTNVTSPSTLEAPSDELPKEQLLGSSISQVSPVSPKVHRFNEAGELVTQYSDGSWKPEIITSHSPSSNAQRAEAIRHHITNWMPTGTTQKMIVTTEGELKQVPTDSLDHKILSSIITVLEQAKTRQRSTAATLHEQVRQTDPDTKLGMLNIATKLTMAEEHNSRPDKLEQIAAEIKENYEYIKKCREKAQEIIADLNNPNPPQPLYNWEKKKLEFAKNHLEQAILLYADCIEQQIAFAEAFSSQLVISDPTTKQNLQNQKWTCVKKNALARQCEVKALASLEVKNSDREKLLQFEEASYEQIALEAKKPNQNEQAIALYMLVTKKTQAAINRINHSHDNPALVESIKDYHAAAQEAQKETNAQKSERTIALFLQAATLWEESSDAKNENLTHKGRHLFRAARNLQQAAKKAQKKPADCNQELADEKIIALYVKAANLDYQIAQEPDESDHTYKDDLLQNRVRVITRTITETRDWRREEAFEALEAAEEFYVKAVLAYDLGQEEKSKLFAKAGEISEHSARASYFPHNFELYKKAVQLQQLAAEIWNPEEAEKTEQLTHLSLKLYDFQPFDNAPYEDLFNAVDRVVEEARALPRISEEKINSFTSELEKFLAEARRMQKAREESYRRRNRIENCIIN